MADAKETKQVKQVMVEPVYGPMVHILKGYPIDGVTKVEEIDPWLQAQIDAGKVKVVS